MVKKKLKIDLSPAIKNLEIIAEGLVNNKTLGKYKSKFKGKGLEFDSYREYNLGYDDAQYIDWKASKRGNKLLIKQFVEERNMNIFFLIDASSTMMLGSTKLLKMEYAAHLAASLYYVILAAGDTAGFAMYTDHLVTKQQPSNATDAFFRLSRSLVDINNYGGKSDLSEAIRLSLAFLKQNDIMIIISDFIGLKPDWSQTLKIAAARYDIIGMMVRDPTDKTLPIGVGQVTIEDPDTGKQMLIQPEKVKENYEKLVKQQEAEIKSAFNEIKADFLSLNTQDSFIKPVMTFFRMRGGP